MKTAYYLDRIRGAFPKLQWTKYRRIQDGWDHVVIMLDNEIVFRFERRTEVTNLLRERTVLSAIKDRVKGISIPDYKLIPTSPDFAGYRAIPGTRLAPWRFARLSQSKREVMAKRLGAFLSDLHAIPVSEVKGLGVDEEIDWESALWRRPLAEAGFRKFAHRLEPEVCALFKKWIEDSHLKQHTLTRKFTHSDLWHKHIYHDPYIGQLTGIIDWGDMEITDPARDFYGFWAYGEKFVDSVLAHYRFADQTIKDKSFEFYWTQDR